MSGSPDFWLTSNSSLDPTPVTQRHLGGKARDFSARPKTSQAMSSWWYSEPACPGGGFRGGMWDYRASFHNPWGFSVKNGCIIRKKDRLPFNIYSHFPRWTHDLWEKEYKFQLIDLVKWFSRVCVQSSSFGSQRTISTANERKRHHERTAFGWCPAESDLFVHDQVAQIE